MKTVYIIFAFCAGLFLGHILFPSEREIKPVEYVQLNETKKHLAKIDSSFVSQKLAYKKQEDSLVKKLTAYKFLLANAHKELFLKREGTFSLINRIKDDLIYQNDSILLDSLTNKIAIVNLATDSLIINYERKDSLMQYMVAIRDTQIVLCTNSYLEIKNLSQEQMLREQKLKEDLNTALKQQKRKRVQNKILAAGMLFVSGITTTLFIKSRQ